MRRILRQNNLDLLREVRRVKQLLVDSESRIPNELERYYNWARSTCQEYETHIEQNLKFLKLPTDDILQNVHSRTQSYVRGFRLFDQMQVSPIVRAAASDRLSLILIQWMHKRHSQVHGLPAAISDGATGIWTSTSREQPILYLLPCTVQRGLLYLPLLFHEIGHQLYLIHKPEMDALVEDLQGEILSLVRPSVRRNDRQEGREKKRHNAIVETWYEWAQELFCDAVGFTVGGPAFLHAFSMFMRMRGRGQFHEPSEHLVHRSHPVAWIRVQLLADRARATGFSSVADALEEDWSEVASSHGVTEDYYGFYDESFLPVVRLTLDHMIVETNPCEFSIEDTLSESRIEELVEKPARLLNRAWEVFLNAPSDYGDWEERAIEVFLQSSIDAR